MVLKNAPNTDEWLTPEEAAARLHMSKWTVIRRCKEHRLPAQNFGSEKRERWFVSVKGLEELREQAVAGVCNGKHQTTIGEQVL